MTAWPLLLPAAAVLAACSVLSYHERWREAGWFIPVLSALCVANGVLWALACRGSRSQNELFALSVAWDALTILTYSVMPLVFFGVRLGPAGWLGLSMVVVGAILCKNCG